MIGHYDRAGRPIDMWTWCALFERGGMRYKRVARTHVWEASTGRSVEISTVWLGTDMGFMPGDPPMIFETMSWDSDGEDEVCDRYTSEAEAVAAHQAHVALAAVELTDPVVTDVTADDERPDHALPGTSCTLGYNEKRGGYILLGDEPYEPGMAPTHRKEADGLWWPTHPDLMPYLPVDMNEEEVTCNGGNTAHEKPHSD